MRTKEEIEQLVKEYNFDLSTTENHYFCTENWIGEHKENYNQIPRKNDVDYDGEGNTLGNLRKFVVGSHRQLSLLKDNLCLKTPSQ